MDPHLDEELKEYLRLIDATVKSASHNHFSPQKIPFSSLSASFKANEFLQTVILMSNNCEEKEQKSSQQLKRKKPEILDDSIDWNVGSQQTTLESPKSQDDIKDLCAGIQGLSCSNGQGSLGGQSMIYGYSNNQTASQQFSSKLQRYFPEQNEQQQHSSCLCSLDQSQKPSRNIIVQLSQQFDIEQFIAIARSFGDIQNIDRHKFQYERTVVLSFYNMASSLQAFQQMSTPNPNIISVCYLNDFNDFDYIDYMLISNANSFNQKLVLDYLGCFGKIFEYSSINCKLIVRYFDVRSLKEVDRVIKLLEKDRKAFVYLHRTHFPEVEEKFILELLKNIFIFSKENTTDILLKNSRVKSTKSNIPHQQQQQSSSSQLSNQITVSKVNSNELNFPSQQIHLGNILPISPQNNTQSPQLQNVIDSSYTQKMNQQPFFVSQNYQAAPKQQTMNNNTAALNNFFNFEEQVNNTQQTKHHHNENVYQSNFINQQPLGVQFPQQHPFGCNQRQELQEISDYQNFFIPTQQQQPKQQKQQNKFISPNNSNNSLSENIFNNNENENIPLHSQQYAFLQQKKIKKLNPNSTNFNSNMNYNSNGSNSNNNNFSGNILQGNCSPNMLSNQCNPHLISGNCQVNLNQLSQSHSNIHVSQENSQMQLIQQISQSSSSSLTSTKPLQYNQGLYNNYNPMRISQDENPFSANSLRMSFDNNPIFQMNNSFYQNSQVTAVSNNNNNNCNNNNGNNSASNINSNNTLNINAFPTTTNSIPQSKQQVQVRQQSNQQTQFMNLLNYNNQFMNEMHYNNFQNNNAMDSFEGGQMSSNLTLNTMAKQFSNNQNLPTYQNQSCVSNQIPQTKINTILGSNGAKSHNMNQNFQVNLDNITQLKDRRATIMVRNIPNRYNQEDFLRIIDINYKGLYDFVYLPMDFKNHCNIGYAFINFIDAKHIIPFYNEFNGKRWEMIRSEKVCFICYARIQGRNELIAHFKKSGVMSAMVDKSFKPLILPNPQLDLQILSQ